MRPLKRLIFAFVIAGILCQLSFTLFIKEIKKYQQHNTERLTELLTRNTAYDVLFLGSSRTHFDINPAVIDSVCNTRSYNAGVEGGGVYEFEMMLRAYLENHPAPKWLVLDLDLHSFNAGQKMFNYPVYFPYLQNKVIKRYLSENGHLTPLKKAAPFLRIMDYDDDAKGNFVKGMFGKSEIPPGDFQYKGYISNTSVTVDPNETLPARSAYKISDEGKANLDSIVNICRKYNCGIIFMYAPEYKKRLQEIVSNADQILNYMQGYAGGNNIPFLRDDNLDICADPMLFANFGHLNKQGAQTYSVILGAELNAIIHK